MGRSKHRQTLDVSEFGRGYFCGDVSLFWGLETFEDLESPITRDSYCLELGFHYNTYTYARGTISHRRRGPLSCSTVLTNCKLLGDRDGVERSKDLM